MNYVYARENFRNQILIGHNEASWPAIVDLIFDIVAHRDRLMVKRKALGRRRRKFARRNRIHRRQP